jgi:hypothetical protein
MVVVDATFGTLNATTLPASISEIVSTKTRQVVNQKIEGPHGRDTWSGFFHDRTGRRRAKNATDATNCTKLYPARFRKSFQSGTSMTPIKKKSWMGREVRPTLT